jgi:predicted dehydrogenase
MALINPAKKNSDVVVAAVAARDASRAHAFATKHGIPRVHENYDALIADPDLDAVYNPLPNGLHGRWTRAALAAGKHVLCEKPFTANAAEAREIADLAAKSDRVVMEAFHYRYHPLSLRAEEIVASGELGKLKRVETAMCFPLPKFSDIRYNYSLAGGATMDAGCYAVHMSRFGASKTARSTGRPGHDGRVAVPRRAHRAGALLDVVDASAPDQRPGGWQRGRAARAQSRDPPDFPSTIGPIIRRQTRGAFLAPPLLRVSARRFRRSGAARRTGQDDPGRRD